MRALHLLGLRGPEHARLRYKPPTDEPLVLPSWLPSADREVLLAFYQEVLGAETLPRLEVDWDYSLVPSDAAYLRHARLHHGSERDLVVVRVRRAGVDLHDVVATQEIGAFQHVAIACDHPALNETVGRLRELAELVGATARDLYELTEELPLRADGIALLEPLVRTILNPIPVLEAYNALIRLHGELLAAEAHRDAVYRSVLGQLLDDLPVDEIVGLAALVLRGVPGFDAAMGERNREVEASLRARMVILDGRLIRWARFLEEPQVWEIVEDRIRRLAAPPPHIDGLAIVQGWLSKGGPAPSAGDPISAEVIAVFSWINEGKLGRAADTLASLERRLSEAGVTDMTRSDFWRALGRLRAAEGRWDQAEFGFRRSKDVLDQAGAGPTTRAVTMHDLACGLRDNGRWSEAEVLFRDALQLKQAGSDTPTSCGFTLQELARGLRTDGRWPEAEPLFREALRLAEEGGATPTSRSIAMDDLARGLRDEGRWPEAEPLFREALRLAEEGGDTPTGRGIAMDQLARGLRDNGRWSEAEPLFHTALQLKEEGGDTLVSRGGTMDQLARGLRDNGRWPEAEPRFREALRLKKEGGATPMYLSITTDHLARGLRDHGEAIEAELMFREAMRLVQDIGLPSATEPPVRRMQLNESGGNRLRRAGSMIILPTGPAQRRAYATTLRAAGQLEEARRIDDELVKLESKE